MNLATIESILLSLLVIDAIALTVLVLLQQGKGADAGASFGGGGANTMFGSLGAASFFTKATAWLAIGFFLITFALAFTAKERAAAAGNLGIPSVENVIEAPANEAPATDVPVVVPGEEDVPVDDVPEL